MESKFVWKAKTVFQNAAAKAERVLTEIKADFVAELSSASSASQGSGSESKGELPWAGVSDQLEDDCRRLILDISKSSDFLHTQPDGKLEFDMGSAMAILEYDGDLRELRFQYVPTVMKEKEFWKRYFAAVKRVKEEIMASDEPAIPTNASVCKAESLLKDPVEEEADKKGVMAVSIPSSVVIRRLASAVEYGKGFETMYDLAGVTEKDSSQVSEWSSLVSGLKKFSIRDKKSRAQSGFAAGRYHFQLRSLFEADTQYEEGLDKLFSENKPKLSEELHAAPPQSFVAQLAEIVAALKTEQKMAELWLEVVKECRQRWGNGQPIPRMHVDANPDLNYCSLHQQIQVINCCIARRKRRLAALESLQNHQADPTKTLDSSSLFAKLKDGHVVPRICADCQAENLKMLETGEPIYSPITQEGPVLTEDSIKENEELVLRTGSFGAGCSQLFSDMQAFKAANPGCILEDFVRWYSPLDWREDCGCLVDKDDQVAFRGSLSARMKCEGNLWQELWFSARPVPAVSQSPLFDEELAGESTLDGLENIAPADFFEQLFTTALSTGFAIAEAGLSAGNDASEKCLKECKNYILSNCHRHMDSVTIEHVCEVYELMERAIHAPPEEVCDSTKALAEEKPDLRTESRSVGNQLAELRKFLQKKQTVEKQSVEDSQGGPVSSMVKFFEGKVSLFDRKSKQQSSGVEDKKLCSMESGDWTLV